VFKVENGQVIVPQGPGLGLDVDLDKLEKYAVNATRGPRP
jgi:L-alanine-DL-glutamate epimerase-like enolase superfamily enzyme